MKFDYFWDKKIGPIFIINIKNKDYGLCLCHRMPERSIPFFGIEKYLCARCLGLSLGGSLGIILNQIGYYVSPILALICLIPMLIDGFSQAFHLRESNNYLRLSTGFFFGFGLPSMLKFFLTLF
jgi:uncharacterized membrane protein